MQDICLASFPEVIALQNNDEDVSQLSSLQPALLLERWLSHHLASAAATEEGNSGDSEESTPWQSSGRLVQQYAALLHVLEPSCCVPAAMRLAIPLCPVCGHEAMLRNRYVGFRSHHGAYQYRCTAALLCSAAGL